MTPVPVLLGLAVTALQVGAPGAAPDTVEVAQAPSPLSDLAVRFGVRGDFDGDWTVFRPCDASFQLTCRPGLVPELQPELQFGLLALGSVSDRLFMDVDYDQTREFSGSNRFQVYYQGQAGEPLQRLEIGDVSFALPETRFLTRGIPVGNFGMLARGNVSGVELQTVFAQQRGARRTREFRLEGLGAEAGVIYRDTLELDDADYVKGQFFFLVDPAQIAEAPHLDILSLRPGDAPPGLAPGAPPIQLYRMERNPVLRQQVEGYIQADATLPSGAGVVRESGWFRYLRPGEDYYLHPSGLWVALRAPLAPDEALAVTYVAQNGDVIGHYNPEAIHNAGRIPTLRLVRATRPQHQPGRPTWDLEIKQVYRVSGSDDVDRRSLQVSISLGEESWGRTFRILPDGRTVPFLRLFGVDEQAPLEAVDPAAVFQPAEELVGGGGLQGTFVVFPTLRPFLDPPPIPSEGLSAAEVAVILGPDRNPRIYEADDPFEREAGGLYRVNLSAEIRSSGVTSVFSLGAFGLRPGSERIYLGDRVLRPLTDYVIDYQAGVVTLLQPGALLARSTSDVLRVSWEEPAVFQIAPTSVVGMSARVPMTTWGELDLIGLYQVERELVNRPRFGVEPGTLGLFGATSRLAVPLPALTRALEGLTGDALGTEAELRVEGEIAVSVPDPNRSGDAYLDDFDTGDERVVSVLTNAWNLGSSPAFRTGAETIFPPALDEAYAAPLVWQHTWVERGPAGDSIGVFEGYFPGEIDRQIRVTGTQTREAGLRVTFGGPGPGPYLTPLARSITTLLSPSGADLTYTEFLDFYVSGGDSLVLVVDLGLASEDALFLDSDGQAGGVHLDTGRPWGIGVLDQEADPLAGEIWGPTADETGVWAETCRAIPGRVHPPGLPVANCTAANGRLDTEDLNRSGVLDTTERYARYVVRLDGSSPFLARDRPATGTGFRLYRIPLRGPHTIAPAGDFTEADWRSIQVMRVTVVGRRASTLTLARMRLVGSRWVKRSVGGVLRGIGGDTLALGGRLEVTPVSVVSEAAYQAPPGVLELLDDPTAVVSGRGVEFNEKSLALRYEDVAPGDRAEVYFRFLQRPQNFLAYGELRLWAVARAGTWGESVPSDFFVKVGTDAENFYLYRSRMVPAASAVAVVPEDWLPERVLHFHEWTSLRRRAEQRLLDDPPGPGDPPVIEWSADSTYAVVLKDRARAPNLAAVREISIGVWNRSILPVSGEVWVNELRLGRGIRTTGTARYLTMELDGGELLQARFGYTGTGPFFRQLEENPTYQSESAVSLSGTLQLGALVPAEWGWDLPFSVAHLKSAGDPLFLSQTDLRADELPGLRTPGVTETRVSLAFRSEGATGRTWVDRALGGLDLGLTVTGLSGTTPTGETRSSQVDGGAGYTWRPESRTIPLVPDLLEPVVRILVPGFLLDRFLEADLRWMPEEIGVRSGLYRRSLTLDRFEEIVVDAEGPAARSTSAPEARLETSARLAFRPFVGMGLSVDLITARDLLDPVDGVRDPRVRPAVEAERRRLLGADVGWETRREVVGRLTFQPDLPPWLRADLGIQTRYLGEQDPGFVRFETLPDSIPRLLRNARGERELRATLTVDPDGFLVELLGPAPAGSGGGGPDGGVAAPGGVAGTPGPEESTLAGIVRIVAGAVSPLTVSWQDGITSRFHREGVDPGAAFQLGWGSTGSFEALDQVTATTLAARRGLSAGSGLQLPGSFFVNVNYQTTRTESLDRRSDREGRGRIWPDLRVGVGDLPFPAAWEGMLAGASASVGFQRTRDESSYVGGLLQRRMRVDRRVPVEVALEWVGGVVTRYRSQLVWGQVRDPTGTTDRAQVEHRFSVESRLPQAARLLAQAATAPRISLSVDYSEVLECRVAVAGAGCVGFIDQVNRGVQLALETVLQGVEVGGQVSLVDRRSFVGLRTGFTQLHMGLWGRLVIEAGPVGQLQGTPDPF